MIAVLSFLERLLMIAVTITQRAANSRAALQTGCPDAEIQVSLHSARAATDRECRSIDAVTTVIGA